MPLASQNTDPQDGDDTHDEGTLVKTQRTSFEAHANAQSEAPRQGDKSDQQGRKNKTSRGGAW